MTPFFLALAFAVALWWLGTGVVLALQQRLCPGDGDDEETNASGVALGVGAGGLAGALVLLVAARDPGVTASLTGFTAALVLWGALELSHYLGFVTGTHARSCPDDVRGWSRFRLALGTSIHHELSVLIVGLVLVALLHDAPNTAGLLTFAVLWSMRWSAKLNLFLGVPNFSTEWFPARLSHLASYIRTSPVSAFYPVSLTLATIATIAIGRLAIVSSGPHSLMHALPAALLALAVIEHLFMVLPIADTRLWNRVFGVRARASVDADSAPARPVDPVPFAADSLSSRRR